MPQTRNKEASLASQSQNQTPASTVSEVIVEIFQNEAFLKKVHDIVRSIAREVADTSFAKLHPDRAE